MPDRFVLRRSSTADEWRSDAEPQIDPGPTVPHPAAFRRRALIAVSLLCFAVASLLAALSVVLIVSGDDNGSDAGESDQASGGDPQPSQAVSGAGPVDDTPAERDELSLALWSEAAREWTFGDLNAAGERYDEDETVPFLVTWPAGRGRTYEVTLTYDCESGEAQAIDYLTGVAGWGPNMLEAEGGPGRAAADASVQVANTSDFPQDDGRPGLLLLYGATSSVPPQIAPHGECNGQRTLSLSVEAIAETATIAGAAHLASAAVHGADKGASSADRAFGLEATVGAESAAAQIARRVVSNR